MSNYGQLVQCMVADTMHCTSQLAIIHLFALVYLIDHFRETVLVVWYCTYETFNSITITVYTFYLDWLQISSNQCKTNSFVNKKDCQCNDLVETYIDIVHTLYINKFSFLSVYHINLIFCLCSEYTIIVMSYCMYTCLIVVPCSLLCAVFCC